MMNSARLLERRAASICTRFASLHQARAFSALRATFSTTPRPFLYRNQPALIRTSPRTILRQSRNQIWRGQRHNGTKQSPNPTPHLGSPEPAPSLSQRLKQLSREYGWAAVGWYLLLSALDFPFCFLAVRALGTERIGQWEHAVIEAVKSVIQVPFPQLIKDTGEGIAEVGEQAHTAVREGNVALDSAVKEVAPESDATIWTQLALAYAIHKSFIFIRVPLTAATLPKVVKTLRSWGWNIGKKTPKPT